MCICRQQYQVQKCRAAGDVSVYSALLVNSRLIAVDVFVSVSVSLVGGVGLK